MFLSLGQDAESEDDQRVAELSVRALCSNRHLAERLPVGESGADFRLLDDVTLALRCLAGPTRPREPPMTAMVGKTEIVPTGEVAWRLLNMLSLNHLGLVDRGAEEGAVALRETLMLFADLADGATERRIHGVRSLQARPVVRRIRTPQGAAAARGVEMTVVIDDKAFEGSGAFLMGAALDRFFAEYVAINHFTQTVVRTTERGEIMRWPPRLGPAGNAMSFLEQLTAEPWRFDWLATMRRLERANPGKPRIGDSAARGQEFVILSQNPYLEFPDSTVEAAGKDERGRVRVVSRFLGMFGPQGALPLTTTDEAYGWLRARDDAFPRFVDIFQSRFLALFFRAWSDARPIAQHDRPAQDRFRDYVGSVIGLGARWFKDRDSVHDFVKLEYAGLMAPRVKSVSRLRFFLTGLVGSRVEIDEFVGTWLTLEESERTRLGAAQSGLGADCMLGASAYTVSDKFRIRVFARDYAHYEQFLPGATLADQIADAVFAYVGDEYDWDLELAIPAGEVKPVRVGAGARLGWTGWAAPNWSKTDQTWRADARFHLISRRGARAASNS